MAIDLDAAPLELDETALARRVQAGAYDLVVQVGHHVPTALRLAAELGAPLLELGTPLSAPPADLLRPDAIDRMRSPRALLDLTLDERRILTATPARLGDRRNRHEHAAVYVGDAPAAMSARVSEIRLDVTELPDSQVTVAHGAGRSSAPRAEIRPHAPVDVIIDGWPYRCANLVAQAHPTGVQFIKWTPTLR